MSTSPRLSSRFILLSGPRFHLKHPPHSIEYLQPRPAREVLYRNMVVCESPKVLTKPSNFRYPKSYGFGIPITLDIIKYVHNLSTTHHQSSYTPPPNSTLPPLYLHYVRNSLHSKKLLTSLLHGPNSCREQTTHPITHEAPYPP